ncbi:DNA polymerase-4 [Arthrobacter sp. cf158]|nr:DNA polymerase-4 [Arthrobacter sp. cf158]
MLRTRSSTTLFGGEKPECTRNWLFLAAARIKESGEGTAKSNAVRQTGAVSGIPWVLHVDLDQFIAAVEVLRRPELAGKPIIVGGRGDPTERAVVSTASYEARAFGVGSGMPLRIAARKVPDAIILPVDQEAYLAASDVVMATLRAQPGATVQVLGWDEAFVGVETEDPEAYARQIQAAVLEQTQLHCSVGIGDTLVRAKNATDFGKPAGTFRLTKANWLEVMGDKPTKELWGVGPKVSQRLAKHHITTVAELAAIDPQELVPEFGPKMGPWYAQLGRGEGSSEVDDTPWVARAHGRETTFQQDLTEPAQISDAIKELTARVLEDVAAEGRPVIGLTLKVRYKPFFTKTYARKIPESFDREEVLAQALDLTAKIEPDRPIRLLGLRAEMSMPEEARKGHTPTRSGW